MTFTQIVNRICGRLNLTSAEATTQVGEFVNERYRWVCASIGMETTARGSVTASTAVGDQTVTFASTVKLFTVLDPNGKPMDEYSYDELVSQTPRSGSPRAYAIKRMGATSVTILLDSEPTSIETLTADGLAITATLSGNDEPAFAENFHDILLYGGLASQLDKMEKYDGAQTKESQYERRLAELRLFIAKSAYLSVVQGSRGVGLL